DLVKSFQGSANALNAILAGNRDNLNNSLKNLSTITDNFSMLSDSLANAGLGETIKGLQATLTDVNGMLAKVENGEGSLGKLVNDKALSDNLTSASREL